MNNYYELIYLTKELQENVENSVVEFSITPHKNVLESYIVCNSQRRRLVFSANPAETALFLDSFRPPKKGNVVEFFAPINNKNIKEIKLADKDRLVFFSFDDNYKLIYKLFGSRANVFLVKDDTIVDSFKNPDKNKGKNPPTPQAPKFEDSVNPEAKTKNQITRLNPLLPRHLIPHLIRQHEVDEMEPEQVREFVDFITREILERPVYRVLKNGHVCLWGEEVLDIPTEKKFDTINECILYAYKNTVHQRRLSQKKDNILERLEQFKTKLEARLEQLKQADKSLERADEYEKYGHLLMANAHRSVDKGTEKLEIQDFYQQNETIQIPIKDDHSIAQNAEMYYDKASDSRKSYKEAKKQVSIVEQRLATLDELLSELQSIGHLPDLDKWQKSRKDDLEKFGWGGSADEQVESPFRKFKVGKYELWIGKNAKSNDELTSTAHKEDIWLHARGVAGSHAVIRMGNQKDYPPKPVILEAASYTAYFSKARGSKSAPVIYTKRKYIHKPKGAPPGAVVVDREQVIMVPPMKPNANVKL